MSRPKVPEQAAAIPCRRTAAGSLRVCLIRRRGSRNWGIPKGLVEAGDTHEETALNEAWEEAGLRGRVLGDALGTYEYEKWGGPLRVAVYVMDVQRQARTWQECGFRERRWVTFDEAGVLLRKHPAAGFLDTARRKFVRRG